MYYYAPQRKWFLPKDMAEKDRCDHPRTLPNPTLFKRHVGLDHGMGHLASMRPEKNERLPPIKIEAKGRPRHP